MSACFPRTLKNTRVSIPVYSADLEALRTVVEERLKARGSKADAEKLERELQRLEKLFRGKAITRLSKAAEHSETEIAIQPKA